MKRSKHVVRTEIMSFSAFKILTSSGAVIQKWLHSSSHGFRSHTSISYTKSKVRTVVDATL